MTQTLAAAVLRSTQGRVKFSIGREKPSNHPEGQQSEIARLIQQSLEQDRLKEEYLARQAQLANQSQRSPQSAPIAPPSTPPPPMPPVQKRTLLDHNEINNYDNNIVKEETLKHAEESKLIDELKHKLNDYEQQNLKLKTEIDQMKSQCVNFSVKEFETSNELNNLKVKINQMMQQYDELNEKYNENVNKIKYFEQRDLEQNKVIDHLRLEIDTLNRNNLLQQKETYAKAFIENGHPIEIKQQKQINIIKSPLRSNIIINSNSKQVIMNTMVQDLNQSSEKELLTSRQFDDFAQLNRVTPILDNEPSKFKSNLIKRGSLATRHLPHQSSHVDESDSSSKHDDIPSSVANKDEDTHTKQGDTENDDAIYKLRILNSNTPANYAYETSSSSQSVMINQSNDIMNCSSHSTLMSSTNLGVNNACSAVSAATTTTTNSSSFMSNNYSNGNSNTFSFTQPIEGSLDDYLFFCFNSKVILMNF